ncbi:MAG TPA: phosphoribosyltransferase family protein [Roseomonas sp.]|nr:phosphoribosyltransferase family protein [Roseomonas sp.]
MRFRDRREAGRALVPLLAHLRQANPLVLALPRGGVPVAAEIAEALDAPLDILIVRKLGAPGYPEFAAGAVVEGHPPEVVRNEEAVRALGIGQDYLDAEAIRQCAEIERQQALYRQSRPPLPWRDRTLILVDDGIATGSTVRAALLALRRPGAGRRVVLAAPVAPDSTAAALRTACDEAVFVETPADFGAVGAFYEDFGQVGDAEVIALLDRAVARHAEGAAGGARE